VQAGDIQVTSSRRRTINPRFSIKGALGGMFLFYSFSIVTRITLPLAVKDGLKKAEKDVVGVAKDAVGAVKDVAGGV
jgi:hypothetical protein